MATPLHAALGDLDAELSLALVEDACAQGTAETDQLDWKRDLPLSVDRVSEDVRTQQMRELAKDLAAMANGRGGLLVYGVAEDGGNRASEIVSVPDLSDGTMVKKIRQVGYNLVHPPVQITCHHLTDGERHVLAVDVVESDDAPHLVSPKKGGTEGWLVAPYRSGPETMNMVEKQLEAAYRQRFEGRQRRHRQLRELHGELVTRHVGEQDLRSGAVVALAQPIQPRSGVLPGTDPDVTALHIVTSAAHLATNICDALKRVSPFPPVLAQDVRYARRSLRRHWFAAERRRTPSPAVLIGPSAKLSVELHDDGTVGIVWRRGEVYSFTRSTETTIPTPSLAHDDVDGVTLLLLALVEAVSRELNMVSDYQVHVSIEPRAPLHVIPEDGRADEDYQTVPSPPPLESDLRMTNGPARRAADFLALSLDMSSMVEQRYSMLEGFWQLPLGTRVDHPARLLAQRLLGGAPNHPVTDQPM
ncbi:RNA-binding domain-containing protein [Janibacter cremeus]|uniref:RNA-binding domain-containing protein n=1 Tax=Janibacter cremeus TaxID=1285192 RepID=UPI00163DBE3C